MSRAEISIRRYRGPDFEGAARLVRGVFAKFVMPDATPRGVDYWTKYLSLAKANREKLRKSYSRETIAFVALDRGKIIGVVMGTTDELKRVFVRGGYRRKGIGRGLMRRYERECLLQGGRRFRITASLYAVPFYTRMGCRRTTGIRSFHGLKVQPMERVLPQPRQDST